ncbi:MAG: AAA family ATPase, partial [Actinobacteria bacterium]|nr:AAA family ATPase [Actinomycetota bacterium]
MEWSCAACGTSWPTTYSFCAFCGQARAAVDTSSAEIDDVLRALVGDQLRTELVSRGGKLPEERRLVSAVFADLSGFTPLAGRLDPEALAEVVDPILAALVRIVKRGDGHVGSFAGDALLAYFGAPVAHEDDAARAVRCAQEMLAEFPALLAAAPDEAAGLSLRIGIDTGAVMARLVAGDIRTDYNILGNSVNMAQRLQSNAPPGGCVVGETTFDLTKDAFDFDHLGGLQVKGRAEPLPAWLLVGDRAPAVQRRRRRTSRMVGREAELAALARVEADGGALLLIAEAGAGKSRLLEESRSRSVRAWLEGGCAPHDSTTSFRPWVGALAGVSSGSDGLRVLRGDPDAALAALPPAQRRDLVARDVASTLASLAPVVVVLEDLHWADQASLDLLDDLLHMLPSSVTVLASSREPLSLTATVDALDLQPLVADDVAALVSDLLEGDPPTVLVHDIVRRCGGNPLYVAELALAMRERGLVEKLDGEVLVASASALEGGALDLVPNSLEGLIGARIDALPNAEERVLTIAAVLGAPVSADLISAVSIRLALPHQEIGAAIDGLRAARILDGGRFVHAVVQNTAYMRTTRARRRTLHLAAADSCHPLIAAEEQAGFLARHLYLAGAGPRAVDALEAAADQALELGRHDEAVLHLRREVELRLGSSASAAQREAAPQRRVV